MAVLPAEIPVSETLEQACAAFLDEIGEWISDCIGRYADAPPTDGHDQMTFTTAWAPYIQARGGEKALAFMKMMRDKIAAHFRRSDAWLHGYWRTQEAHHGTEHFELFLGTLLGLDPTGRQTVAQLLDAAEHMGNWVAGIPQWFNWDTGLFRSVYFGTEVVRDDVEHSVNLPAHFRCVNICLPAWRMTETAGYLDVAAIHARKWADAILADERLPLGLIREGAIYRRDLARRARYGRFVGQSAPTDVSIDRAESLLASSAVNALLTLWQITEQDAFRAAAERICDVLAGALTDPDAGCAADVLRTHRRITGQTRYDEAILDAAAELDPFSIVTLSIDPEVPRGRRPSGIGKRADMPLWHEDGRPRRCAPILLAAAAEITEDRPLATRAVDLGRAYFHLARHVYGDGREHGCSARSISAIARGHGRENHAGVVTAVLAPLLDHFHVQA